jgi:hypothetical protein
MAQQIGELYPGCAVREAAAIAAHTAVRGSGRMGRTAAGRNLDEAAVAAAVRHTHTNYDELLAAGLDRDLARRQVADRVQENSGGVAQVTVAQTERLRKALSMANFGCRRLPLRAEPGCC